MDHHAARSDLSKTEEVDLLREFILKLPQHSYLRLIFCKNGLAADIEKAIANDFGFIQRTPESLEKEWREADKALKSTIAYHDTVQAKIAKGHATLQGLVDKLKRLREGHDAASGSINKTVADCEETLAKYRQSVQPNE